MVWQKAMLLVEEVYRLTQVLPADERYGLASQLRRAAVSVPSNIAEGHARSSTKEYLHHVSFAFGSLAEMETQVELCKRLGYLVSEDSMRFDGLSDEVGKMLRGLRAGLARIQGRVREDADFDYDSNPLPP